MLLRPLWQVRVQGYRLSVKRTIHGRGLAKASSFLRNFVSAVERDQTPSPSFHELHPSLSREVRERTEELQREKVAAYPRWPHDNLTDDPTVVKNGILPKQSPDSLATIRRRADAFDPTAGESTLPLRKELHLAGRICAVRRSGKKLFFLDVVRGNEKVQVILNLNALNVDIDLEQFQHCSRLLRRGDYVSVQGIRTGPRAGGPSSLLATCLPVLQAPCLQRLPLPQSLSQRDTEKEFTAGRHVEMLTYPDMATILRIRAELIRSLRQSLELNDFLEVQTPILSASAGGASARPFVTTATEFSDRKLTLRIAPELWLKRLVVGGIDQVFEIGPSFRNEGLDRTHNPEFTTCEFYATYLDIDRLMSFTERIFNKIGSSIRHLNLDEVVDSTLLREWSMHPSESFERIDFIPAINQCLETPLPNLASPTAVAHLLAIFHQHSITVPSPPTLPRLIDKLSSHFLEPKCRKPTWIINIPECLSPLSKSFIHPTAPNNQSVAARAELYMRCKEVVNCYEEENSPFEQRRKFLDQQRYARDPDSENVDEEAMQLDEDYIRSLEWGLPPTGGWGCGIDRLVMLVTKQDRIGNVLSFGNLRAVARGAEKWTGQTSVEDENKNC